jgi:hypothetical protein
MKIETIENVLKFLEEKEGKKITDRMFHYIEKLKLIKELENHPDGEQYRYEGDLNLNFSKITKLPNNLYVDGSLDLFDCKQLTELPIKLYVDGDLDLGNCNRLTKLPDKLYVGGSLNLTGCSELTEIPNNLYVGRSLFIDNTPLAKKYTNEQIREIVTSTGGQIIGKINRNL